MNPLVALVDYDSDLFDVSAADLAAMTATIAAAGGRLEVAQRRTEAAVVAMARDATIVMIQSVRPLLNANTIPALAQCQGIIRLGLGYDSVDVAAATAAGIPVSNVIDWCNEEVAEHAVALIFAAVRRIAQHDRRMRAGLWDRLPALHTPRLAGKTVGLLGFGRIARAVALRLAPFGVRLLAGDPRITEAEAACCGVTLVPFDTLLAESDILSVHARLEPGSFHLLDAAAFARMKPGALLVNTARGPIVNETALVEALTAGTLGGAALDVMESEPLAATSPLRTLDNVTLTPHISSYSAEAVRQLYRQGAAIAAEFLAGGWPATVVNPEVRTLAAHRTAAR